MRKAALIFSPTGGVRRAAELLTAQMGDYTPIDLSLAPNGADQLRFTARDRVVIAVPTFGGRVPPIALARLSAAEGGGARAVLLSVYGNRSDDDTLYELRDAACAAGFFPVAAVRAIAEHSLARHVAEGRPDEADARVLGAFGAHLRKLLEEETATPLDLPQKRWLRPIGAVPVHPRADKRRCVGCGKCAALCPMGAIPREAPTVTNEMRCITCMRCVKVCPMHARKLNWLVSATVARKLKRRYSARKEPELLLGRAPDARTP